MWYSLGLWEGYANNRFHIYLRKSKKKKKIKKKKEIFELGGYQHGSLLVLFAQISQYRTLMLAIQPNFNIQFIHLV